MRISALTLAIGLLLAGCQAGLSVKTHGGMDNAGFMSLWNTYSACQSGTDVDGMRIAAGHLNKMAFQPAAVESSEFHLPKAIERWVSEQPARLAVDPKSMAAACSLYTGQVALSAGRHDVAGEMFQAVLKYPGHTSQYYIEQARAGLEQIKTAIHASLPSSLQTPRLILLSNQLRDK